MALDKILQRDAAPSAVNMNSKDFLYTLATLNSDGELAVPAAGTYVYGSIYEGAPAGKNSTVGIDGWVKAKAATAFSVGDEVATDADGKAVIAAAGDYVFGRVRYATGSADALVTIHITREGVKA